MSIENQIPIFVKFINRKAPPTTVRAIPKLKRLFDLAKSN
jgi:hypothetical protein